MFGKKTIDDIDVAGKRVLLRADYNVPLAGGKISGDYRIKQSLPTLRALADKGAKVIICSHLGRPNGKRDVRYSLAPVAKRLSKTLDKKVLFAQDCVGDQAQKAVSDLQNGEVLLLENLRFHPGEESNDDEFAKQLATLADVFVQDGFGVVHRAHASTSAITQHLPSVAGPLLVQEVNNITKVMTNPKRPFMAIVGGAKISDKIDVLNKFIDIADFVAIGGAMANTFLVAEGVGIGQSKYESDAVEQAEEILAKAQEKAANKPFVFYTPQDAIVAKSLDKGAPTRLVDFSAHTPALTLSYPKTPAHETAAVAEDEMILDIGPFSAAFIAGAAQLAGTVVWNGTLGVTEVPALHGPVGPFAHGTETIIEALAGDFGNKPYSLIGGGDTAGYVESRGLTGSFNFVSTGGGASLDLMAGRNLPGVDALQDV